MTRAIFFALVLVPGTSAGWMASLDEEARELLIDLEHVMDLAGRRHD